jgi:hypothetical protein
MAGQSYYITVVLNRIRGTLAPRPGLQPPRVLPARISGYCSVVEGALARVSVRFHALGRSWSVPPLRLGRCGLEL